MRTPIIVVTGGIATGKSTVARMLADRRGTVIDCDAIGHAALESNEVKRDIERFFGPGALTPAGRVSRAKLGRIVFCDGRMLERLNGVIRPVLKKMIEDEVSARRGSAGYIVLDAVLYFQYKFRFKVDLVIRTVASREARIGRLVTRDGMTRMEALERIERQEHLERGWRTADVTVRTGISLPKLRERVSRIRDRFLASHGLLRGKQ
jgi:dephospho-CoA kinase